MPGIACRRMEEDQEFVYSGNMLLATDLTSQVLWYEMCVLCQKVQGVKVGRSAVDKLGVIISLIPYSLHLDFSRDRWTFRKQGLKASKPWRKGVPSTFCCLGLDFPSVRAFSVI